MAVRENGANAWDGGKIHISDTIDDFVQELREQIFEETREVYGELAFQRWQNPLYMGAMKHPDGYAILRGVCGDTMEVFLDSENDRVKEASFQTDGCGSSRACGSFAAEMAIGKNPDELPEITGEAIIEKPDGLPREGEHCATLASKTLHGALNAYMIKQSRR